MNTQYGDNVSVAHGWGEAGAGSHTCEPATHPAHLHGAVPWRCTLGMLLHVPNVPHCACWPGMAPMLYTEIGTYMYEQDP